MPEILERGDIYFFYRPKVHSAEQETEEISGPEDVQRFFFILHPRGQRLYRRIVVGRKRLPELSGERSWGFVEDVVSDPAQLREVLKEHDYQTKTRGEREEPRARPAGEGVYALVRHGSHVNLAYSLELPKHPGEVQQELDVKPEASYIIAVKNPEQPSPRGVGLAESQRADLPKRQQQKFRHRRFVDADPQLLDHKGTELVLIGADEDVPGELNVDLKSEDETLDTAEILKDLKLDRSRFPTAPLIEGRWE
jgi:hypothetical protein